MEGDHEIQKIIYTDGFYSLFTEDGEEHLYNHEGVEVELEDDPEWLAEDPRVEDLGSDSEDYVQNAQNLASSMKFLEEDSYEGNKMDVEPATPAKAQTGPKKKARRSSGYKTGYSYPKNKAY